jgi:hypothetical protein
MQVDNSVDEIGVGSQTPMPATVNTPQVDNARSAVQSAIAAAPFDPAFGGPIASLNAQPMEPAVQDTSPAAAPAFPAMTASDTPMLVLPTNGAGPIAASPTFAPEPPPAEPTSNVAPPPVPPPLMPTPGVVIPTVPPQQ